MKKLAFVLTVLLISARAASAGPIVLTFEGLGNGDDILNFYNGGTSSLGHSGPNFGVQFATGSLAVIEQDLPGGTGNFENEPSDSTAMVFLTTTGDLMDVASGFTGGFSFFYVTPVTTGGSVTVFSGLDGTGTALGTFGLPPTGPLSGCINPQDPPSTTHGEFDCWSPIGVSFSGTAESVLFSGVADQIAFDNVTLGSDTPIATPEPASLLLLGTGLYLGARRLRRAGRSRA